MGFVRIIVLKQILRVGSVPSKLEQRQPIVTLKRTRGETLSAEINI